MRRRWKQPPWVGLCPTPALLDSPLRPSHRRVERSSTHEGPSRLDAAALKTSPVGRAPPDARVPGFAAAPKPAQRRAKLDPRRTFATGCVGGGNNPRGSGFSRRPRPWTRRCTQALNASSEARPTKDLRDWIRRRWKQPPWVGLFPTPALLDSPLRPSQRHVERSSTHEGPSRLDSSAMETTPVGRAPPDTRAPGFAAVPKPSTRRAKLDPRRTFATGFVGDGNNPRGSGFARRPRPWNRRCTQALNASSEARPTKDLRDWMRRRWKQPPWVGLRPTPALLDSPLRPSQRSVERSSTHEGPSPRDTAALKTTPVGRALPDARVPGFAAVPKPSPRRAKLDPRTPPCAGNRSRGPPTGTASNGCQVVASPAVSIRYSPASSTDAHSGNGGVQQSLEAHP